MTYLYKNKKVDSLIEDKNIMSGDSLVDSMVEVFYEQIISEADSKLLALAFKKDISQNDLNEFVKDWDIEVYGGGKSLVLAYVMKANPHLEFSAYEGPRLSGLLNFFRFKNLKTIAHFTKVVRELNSRNITPLLIKGGAMKFLRPELSRIMGDTDIVVRLDEFDESCKVGEDLGYEFGIESNSHSVDLHPVGEEDGGVDIHKYIDFETQYDKKIMNDFFERGSKSKVFGTYAIIPCAEDLVFIILTNLAKNLHYKTSSEGLLFSLFDCKFLIDNKPDFNWSIILDNIKKTNTDVSVYFAIKFLNRIVPDLLPEDILKSKDLERNVTEYCNEVIYFRFFIHDLKMRCKKLKIKNALKDFSVFKQYLKDKPKHFVLKRVRKSAFLVDVFLKLFNK